MDWYSFIKKYVWDENKTPYFVPVQKLSKSQAEHELFSYTFFVALLFAVIAIISLTENAPHGKSPAVALYAFSVSCSAVLFGITKHVYAAYYFAMAPLAVLAYFFGVGFPPNLATIDKLVLIAITLGLLRYSMRVVAIAKAYPHMPEST
jgi:hypothetical protein